jgi:hypothetical protein
MVKMEDPEISLRLYFGHNISSEVTRNMVCTANIFIIEWFAAQQLSEIFQVSLSRFCRDEAMLCSTKTPKNADDSPCLKPAHVHTALVCSFHLGAEFRFIALLCGRLMWTR